MKSEECIIAVLVIAFVGVFLAIYVQHGRISANEGSAVAGLRTIVTSQQQYQGQGQVDQDGDGIGEFGLLGELTGTVNRRNGLGHYRRGVT